MADKSRNLALDRARTFLTLVVLLHHAVIPYTYFGHTDETSWLGFDVIVLATDSFFMAMFFFLSGLFVWPGLDRKTPLVFLRERLLRLAVPGAVGALLLIPLAYYAQALRQTPGLEFSTYWWKTVMVGPWPSGPIWFIWVLLAFDTMASLLFCLAPGFVRPINRVSKMGFTQPLRFWLLLAVISGIAYVPMSLVFGNSHWLQFGPFSLQTSRIFLYASYFLLGAGVGAHDFARGLLSREGRLAKRPWTWGSVTLFFYGMMWALIAIKRLVLHNPPQLPLWYEPAFALLFVLFSASILFAIFAGFLHQKEQKPNWLDRMQGEAYGMFLVHYPITLWLQYFLLDQLWPAIAKATTVFVLTVILSWALTAAIRKFPGATRIL